MAQRQLQLPANGFKFDSSWGNKLFLFPRSAMKAKRIAPSLNTQRLAYYAEGRGQSVLKLGFR